MISPGTPLLVAEDQGDCFRDRVAAARHVAQLDMRLDAPVPLYRGFRNRIQLHFERHTIFVANGHFGAFDLIAIGSDFAGLGTEIVITPVVPRETRERTLNVVCWGTRCI